MSTAVGNVVTAERLRDRLEAVATAPVLLVASDYDGTLSPIVDDPAAAVPDVFALSALIRIGKLHQTHGVVVSGRSLAVLRRLMGEPSGLTLIGTHGAEMADEEIASEMGAQVAELVAKLEVLVARYPGSAVEPKSVGAAFHYRNATDPDGGAAAARAIGMASDAKVIEGKMVVELVLRDVDKGVAIDALRKQLDADAVVFIGDDVTDEDVFEVLGPEDVGIKVGPEVSAAHQRVARQEDVAAALAVLEVARRRFVGRITLTES